MVTNSEKLADFFERRRQFAHAATDLARLDRRESQE
jgi:hypothetical protein